MTKRMLVDATHPEETRVAIVESYRDNNRLEDLDFGLASKPILRGNIYLAKVMRIEPSLQAAFVEYGGNRHGFLPFSEIHPDYFRIPMADRQEGDEGDEASEAEDAQDLNDEREGDGAYDADTGDQDRDLLTPMEIDTTPREDAAEDSEAPITAQQEEPAPEEAQQETPAQQAPTPDDDHPLMPIKSIASSMDDDDTSVGLITDFGNAVADTGSLTEVQTPQTAPESVGGEMTERIVRQHRPRYKIQEVLKRGQVMLIQVVKEERGNKGAALTTFLSLAGRYCVLMPNTDHGGGVSRKITNHQDRRRMKEILDQLEIPEGMAVILRTAGMEQDPPEIQRDLEYLLCMWDNIREQTLQSSAPALIYEEANLIKRSVRDLYSQDIDEILVAGQPAYDRAYEFMRAIMPDQIGKLKLYNDSIPLFIRYQVENQIDQLHTPVVQLRSGGYLVINPTEALVSIDVNSGRATRERHIEETALKTNLEAADEIARQLRLRDLAGLVVIDFIDMEDGRNNAAVERRIKEAMKNDRARLQIGRISPFGLLELSRQRLRPSLNEISFEKCPHCTGTGVIRSADSAALSVLRAIEEEAIKQRAQVITVHIPARVAFFILNQKRAVLGSLESRYDINIIIQHDDTLPHPGYKLERSKNRSGAGRSGPAVNADQVIAETERDLIQHADAPASHGATDNMDEEPMPFSSGDADRDGNNDGQGRGDRGPRRGRFRGNDKRRRPGGRHERGPRQGGQPRPFDENAPQPEGMDQAAAGSFGDDQPHEGQPASFEGGDQQDSPRRRRRGRRGGRRRSNELRDNDTRGGEGFAPSSEGSTERAPRAAAAPSAPHIPVSIHDLDTTPKAHYENPRASSGQPRGDYEVVNPPGDQPKGGWWRRLTGQ